MSHQEHLPVQHPEAGEISVALLQILQESKRIPAKPEESDREGTIRSRCSTYLQGSGSCRLRAPRRSTAVQEPGGRVLPSASLDHPCQGEYASMSAQDFVKLALQVTSMLAFAVF